MDYIDNILDQLAELMRRLIEALRGEAQVPESEPIPIPVKD